MIDLGIGLEVDVVSMRFFQSDGVYNSDEKVVSIEQQKNQFEITLEEKILQYQYEEYKDGTIQIQLQIPKKQKLTYLEMYDESI